MSSSNPEDGNEPEKGKAIANKPQMDGRALGDWRSRYDHEPREQINFEAKTLLVFLVLGVIGSAVTLGFAGNKLMIPGWGLCSSECSAPGFSIDFNLVMAFAVGFVGGTTFSIKWLVHSVAKGKWHLDRRYWRFFVPLIGGVYACVVLTLMSNGFIGGGTDIQSGSNATVAAFAFLVGYFSDGVSGLLSNIANAVFGTLEKK